MLIPSFHSKQGIFNWVKDITELLLGELMEGFTKAALFDWVDGRDTLTFWIFELNFFNTVVFSGTITSP